VDYVSELTSLIDRVSLAAGKQIAKADYEIDDSGGMLHKRPKNLPKGRMAVYCFIYKDNFLKIGKAGPSSNSRYTYDHYDPECKKESSLAKSILNDTDFVKRHQVDISDIGKWIEDHCRRINVLIKEELGNFALDLVETALQYHYKPEYEGFKSQRRD